MENPSPAHDPYAALRLRDYRKLLGAGVLGALGSQAQTLAIGWEIYHRTGSAALLGMTGLVQFVPVLLFSLPAGHTADRFSRKTQLLISQGVFTLSSLGLTVLSLLQGPVPLIFVFLFLAGMSRAFSAPARNALLPAVVPPELISRAVTWNTSGFQLALMAGPALGGACIALFGQAFPAYVVAGSFSVLSILLIARIHAGAERRPREEVTLKTLLAGVQFVWRNNLLLAALTLDLFAVLLGGATALLPIYQKDILHAGPEVLGWLRAAPAVGALAMGLFLTHRPPLRYAGPALMLAVAGFGAATIVFGISTNLWLSLAMLALTGAFDNISVVVRQTLVQLLTPDTMKGRVSAVTMIFISSSNELGEFESGMTTAGFHLFTESIQEAAVASVVAGGIGTIVVVILAIARWPQLLALRSLHDLDDRTSNGSMG